MQSAPKIGASKGEIQPAQKRVPQKLYKFMKKVARKVATVEFFCVQLTYYTIERKEETKNEAML